MRRMTKDLNLFETTVRRVVKKNIGASSLAKKFFLTDRLKALRLEHSKKLLHMLKKKMPILLFSDKKYFTINPASNS